MTINELQPKEVFENFYSLTRIPRPSKKEAQVIAFMKKFGEDLGLETIRLRKPQRHHPSGTPRHGAAEKRRHRS